MRILIVEDDSGLSAIIAAILKSNDAIYDQAATLIEAHEFVATNTYDAILLDRGLPDGDGIELVKHLRERAVFTPVILLTVQVDIADRVLGLDSGADDYISKPFSITELMARLRAVLRRPAAQPGNSVQLGRLHFDLINCEANIDGQMLKLPRRELLVLDTLVRRAGRTVVRSTLEAAVFSSSDEVQSNTLDAHISRLRRKLAEAQAGIEIEGIRGVGYLLRETE